MDGLQEVLYLGTTGYLKINDWINCPDQILLNSKGVSQIVDTDCRDSHTEDYIWPNSAGLWPQVKHAIEQIKNNKIASEVHKPEHTILLNELINRVIKEAGFDVVETPKGQNFKKI